MTDAVEKPEEASAKAGSWRGRTRRVDISLSKDKTDRQSAAVEAAFRAMPEAGAAAAFLNTVDEALGGRPIDLAIAGDDGLAAVIAALHARGA